MSIMIKEFHTKFEGLFMTYPHEKFHMSSRNVQLVVANKWTPKSSSQGLNKSYVAYFSKIKCHTEFQDLTSG
jgi:hypothetical protein